jgi:phosphoesterase RecJ-like protein
MTDRPRRQPHDLLAALRATRKAVLVTHHRPDGDAIGSLLAVHRICKALGIEATPVVPSACPRYLHWLPGVAQLVDFERAKAAVQEAFAEAQTVVCLDFSRRDRTYGVEPLLRGFAGPQWLIDHHLEPEPDFAGYFWDTHACATAQLVYEWLRDAEALHLLDAEAAQLLFTGIVTDSGSFRFASVSPTTHQAAAHLMAQGANAPQVYEALFARDRPARLRYMGFCLHQRMVLMERWPVAYIPMHQADIEDFGLEEGDTEGLVNQPLAIDGIKLAATLRQEGPVVRISLRSIGELPVNELSARFFSGGGHKNAAGGRLEASLPQALQSFEEAVEQFMREWEVPATKSAASSS